MLLLPPTARDADAIRRVLTDSGIDCLVCGEMATLCREVERGAGAVIVAEESLTRQPGELMACVADQPVWSDLATIVLSRSGVEPPKLTALLPRMGNVTVVERPVRVSTFLSVIRSALRGRRRQYEVRAHLGELLAAEAALRRSHDAFFTLVDRAPFGVYVVDSAFRLYSVNAGARSVFENIRPLIGRDFDEVMHVLWPDPFASEAVMQFRRTLATGEPYIAPGMTQTRRDAGIVQSYEWELHRVELPDGRLGVVCYFYESTKLRRAEAEVRESRRKIESALLAGEVGTYFWDIGADRITGDANFLSIFGVAVDERGSAPLADFLEVVHPDDRESLSALIRRTLAEEEAFRAEYRIRHQEGERWVLARGIVERRNDGTPTGWAGVVVDITERKTAEEQRAFLLEAERAARLEAERAGKMKDEFLATLSHEIRTPLNAILGWAHILGTDDTASESVTEGVAVIQRNARVQAEIISDLLDMNRIVSGKIRLSLQRLSLVPVVQAAIETVVPAAEAKGIEIQATLGQGSCWVHGDPDRLQQVFWNLLSNAVKFSPRGERVQVHVDRRGAYCEVRVSDAGEGISPDFLPYVFDRFRQADGSTTRRHGGLGLGLAIVKQLVELHGGGVGASSPGLGAGAAFTVSLPVADSRAGGGPGVSEEPVGAERGQTPQEAGGDISGVGVLVVDDDPDSRELVRRVLEGRRAVVTAASSVEEAIRLMDELCPDVLVSDIGMPLEDGYMLMRRVRGLDAARGRVTAAVALTAYARAEDRLKAKQAGFDHYVTKPFEPSDLIATVARAVHPRG